MIDDDFFPDRIQMRAIGHLLHIAHKYPETPAITEADLYRRVYERELELHRQPWLTRLQEAGLVAIRELSSFVNGVLRPQEPRVSITPAGVYYSVSRSFMFIESARTPTDDFPDEIVETPATIMNYYAAPSHGFLPAADRIVPLNHNSREYTDLIRALDDVVEALKDNELGALRPEARDEKLEELRRIREMLAGSEVSASRLQVLAWGALGFLATEFASKPVGFLAQRAWEAVLTLLGAS